jgi:Type I phosphodiesterase / nucleotide pyrophosphatase
MFRRYGFAGYLHGALLYGSAIACLHLHHNQVASVRDAIVVLLFCQVLFGLWSAAAFLAGALVGRAATRLGVTQHSLWTDGRWLGVLAFGLMFWWPFFLYGLTYDHVPMQAPASAWGMLAYVLAVALAVLLGVWLLALVLRRWLPLAGRPVAVVTAAGHALALLVAVTMALTAPPRQAALATTATTTAATLPAVTETGLDVTLVALDGADWQVLDPLIAAGKLPNFAEIQRRGVAGPLHTFPDSNSSVIWASIYSGARPDQHGILDFYRVHLPGMRPGAGVFPVHRTFFKEMVDLLEPIGLAERASVSRYDLQALPLWEITDHLGLATGVVDGYYYSFPAPRLATAGSFLAAYGLDGFYQQVIAGGGAARLRDLPLFLQPAPETLFRAVKPALTAADFFWQEQALAGLRTVMPSPRLLSFYTHEPDTVQHLFWKWYEPRRFFGVRAADIASKGGEIARMYGEFDRFLGGLLASTDEHSVLMVLSDHGHSPTILHQSFFTQHRHGPPGILLACGGPLRRGARLEDAQVLDIFPTVLALLGLPIPADAAGQPLRQMFVDSFLAEAPLREIPTYRGLWPTALPEGAESGLLSEEMQRLKNLGYL